MEPSRQSGARHLRCQRTSRSSITGALATFTVDDPQLRVTIDREQAKSLGVVMLVGLSSKNAILIVEFAEQLRQRGNSVVDAAIEAAQIWLRPILMTSLAFILGVLPLMFASGSGAGSRHSLGTTVFGGMIVSTVLNAADHPQPEDSE